MINLRTLVYGLLFGLIDSLALPTVKSVSTGALNPFYMILPVLFYAATPLIFLKGLLGGETLTVLNLVWDLSSDVIITLIGLFIFKEHLSPTKLLGVFFSFLALFLLSYEGDGWNTWLSSNYAKLKQNFV